MTGYLMAMGACWGCGRAFMFNPDRVPSIDGCPVCAHCMALANAQRSAQGLDALPILPGAYEAQEA